MTVESSHLLSPQQIAGWLNSSVSQNNDVKVMLPALQRGAVWKPSQIENLWDSLLRGFPIGAVMLAPFDQAKGTKKFLCQSNNFTVGQGTLFHLLDGQQRCNAIALGWVDHWFSTKETAPLSLWIDLDPPEKNDERDFIFRVVTNSHRWGYQRNDPSLRLSASQRRKALASFHFAIKAGQEKLSSQKISSLPLSRVWPWDAIAPIPVSLLLQAIEEQHADSPAVWDILRKKLKNAFPYWGVEIEGHSWNKKVELKLASPTPHMKHISRCFKHLLTQYRIPSLVLPNEIAAGSLESETEEKSERQDPMATWFIRVNSAGTPIGGEELMYSILKSDWPEAEKAIGRLSEHFMPPSRLLLLTSRLILARTTQTDKKPPAAPNITQFRRLIYGSDKRCPKFREQIYDFFDEKKGKAKWIFKTARKLLVYENQNPSHIDPRLPPVLATDIARQAPDAFFLLLAWLDRMKKTDVDNLTPNMKKRIIGVITALAWFSYKPKICLNRLWRRLVECNDEHRVLGFFSGTPLKTSITLNQKREI